MGRYTANDNKSMQCNPNNERYWSSRGYEDDDYEDDVLESAYSHEETLLRMKEKLDDVCVDLFNRKATFRNLDVSSYQHPVIISKQMLFNEVLKEDYSERAVVCSRESAESLLSKFKSDMHIDNIKSDLEMFKYKFVEFKTFFSENYLIIEYDRKSQGSWFTLPSTLERVWVFSEGQEDNIVNTFEESFIV